MRSYKCPFCDAKGNKFKLLKHIEKKHDTEVSMQYPGYTPYRLVYDIVNDKPGHGTCCICGAQTGWNTKTQKYFRICKNPECAKKVREQYESRMMRVYNKTTLLDDPAQQEKMLANRRIAGKYTWSDGKVFTYMGSYEKRLLEFLDKTLDYDSRDIVMPGPVLEYDHNGVKRKWVVDCMILSLNALIEVKDGGDNPNKKNMRITREKTVCKEKMITNQGVYNYIRLTNNDFGQLMAFLAELKMKMIDKDDTRLFRIHEDVEDLQYDAQEEIENACEDIYDYIEATYKDKVNVVNQDAYFEDGADLYGCDGIFLACAIHPKLINADYEDTFKKLVDNIITDVGRAFPEVTIGTYWIDEVEPLRGKIIGIEVV